MGRKLTVASSTLNQWALDFDGNYKRILQSVCKAKELGAVFRTGPELEICGYSCEDHFFENDTYLHSWEVLVELLKSTECCDIIVDVGMPVMHKNCAYNCRVIFANRRILLIRPKLQMCDDGNYRESRWFTSWKKLRQVEDHYLPRMVAAVTGQETVSFGDAVISTPDTCIGFEICEELWNPASTHIDMCLDGVEIICNSSGSYMELRKAHIVADLIRNATLKAGGCYIYSNLRGCDGQRVYFNGCSCVALNGQIVAKGRQFSLSDVEVITATVDLEDIRSYRNGTRSRSHLSSTRPPYPRIRCCDASLQVSQQMAPSEPVRWDHLDDAMQEISYGPACWLWDYLRRSRQGGFLLPLSGGVDSSSVAVIVFYMCRLIVDAVQIDGGNNSMVLQELRRMLGDNSYTPQSPQELCNLLLVTCYMSTENSTKETQQRATQLATSIGSYHLSFGIDTIVSAVIGVFTVITGRTPVYAVFGGEQRENLALQNVQARLRMILAYLFAQLLHWSRGRPGQLLVLGSANVDESLRGYLTKYDCSSADVNPIGSISKMDLISFLRFARADLQIDVIDEIVTAPPTAELVPLSAALEGVALLQQTDEEEMGMTYAELSDFGRLRKCHYCGPYSMFTKLWDRRRQQQSGGVVVDAATVAEKVKHFFRCYAQNRHKMAVLTPAMHAEQYSPDDNRFDHRPLLYNAHWQWQFQAIDRYVAQMKP